MGSILSLDHVTKNFGGLTALNEVSLEVAEGEILGVIGANGSGKSTLFNTICGVYHPTRGQIFFRGHRIDKLASHEICRQGIGRTFQLSEVFTALTVLECVSLAASLHLPLGEARSHATELLERYGLAAKKDWLCDKLTPIELKLVELCKAQATGPRLILLDEVMSGLTQVEAEPVLDQLRGLPQQGITPVVVEHGMHHIKAVCQRVVVLDFGSLIADGTCEEVLSNKTVIDAYLGSELSDA